MVNRSTDARKRKIKRFYEEWRVFVLGRKRFYEECRCKKKREEKFVQGASKEIEDKERAKDFTRSGNSRKRERKRFYEELGRKLKTKRRYYRI